MEPRVSLVTLGVADLARAKAFYAALGWEGQELQETVFVQAGPLAVVLWSRAKLAEDSGVEDDGGSFGGVALAQNVRSRDEVDAIVAAAAAAGASVTRPPSETFYGGYAGVFRDPDGHVWEIAHNPGFRLTEDGALVLPDFG
jgi:predicted lactoylglutathione lyase